MREGDAVMSGLADAAIDPLLADRAYYRVGAATRRLVVVSHRVTPTGGAKPDSGGLAVAIRSALRESGGMWFGWSGEIAEEPTEKPEFAVDGSLTFATLDLSRRDYEEYYIGYANRVLWPLFHYRSALVEFSRRYLAGYLRVNQRFAQRLAPMLSTQDLVWIPSDPPR
jgi:trehalose 6-phosphate synthase